MLKFAQLKIYINNKQKIYIYAIINYEKIMTSQTLLKRNMGIVYKDPNRNKSFTCAFLNTFQASFSVKYTSTSEKQDCIAQGIKIYCKHKRSLCVFTKNRHDPKAKANYIKYSETLRKVIRDAKKQHYSRLKSKSHNKIKTAWNIIQKETE
jgi:hypothetical protein